MNAFEKLQTTMALMERKKKIYKIINIDEIFKI